MEFKFNRTYTGKVKGVIFDWAGTTVDYGCMAPASVFIEVFKSKGIDITVEEARIPMGLHKKDHIRTICRMERIENLWKEVNGKEVSESDVEEMFNLFIPKQIEILPNYSDLIPQTLNAYNYLREKGIKIGSTTGYNRAMMDIVTEIAAKQGYNPDVVVCASEVPEGRPAPWMAFKVAMELNIYPMESFIKFGDTVSDIAEGLNAGMWTVGVVLPSNEVGLSETDIKNINPEKLNEIKTRAKNRFIGAGANFIIDTLDELPEIIEKINKLLSDGKKP